jgi:hypothetical protein
MTGLDAATDVSEAGSDPCAPVDGTQPMTVATDPVGIADLQVDGTYVYWADLHGRISRAPVCGGPGTILGMANSGWPIWMAFDDTWIYVANYASNVEVIPKGGGAASNLALVSDTQQAVAIGVHAGFLYVGTGPYRGGGVPAGPNEGELLRAPLSGDAGVPVAMFIADPVGHLNFDAQNVYWLDISANISRMPVDGGAVSLLVQRPPDSYTPGFAVDATNLYWSDGPLTNTPVTSSSSHVYEQPLSGGAATTLATGFQFSGMAADATNLYWLDTSAQAVQSVSLAGGAVQVLVNEAVAIGPVLDSLAVYWATTDGRIRRIVKN